MPDRNPTYMYLWVGELGLKKGGGARERGIECILYGYCSATAATNYPSLRDSPNGCQGHPRPCLSPPDRPLVTEPDSNDVLTRSTFYSPVGIDDIKCTKRLKPENRKDP